MMKLKDNEKLTEIHKFCINPEILKILGIDGYELYRIYRGFDEEYKFIKDDTIYSIEISMEADVYEGHTNHIELKQYYNELSMGIGLVRLDNISKINDLKQFRKLMDTYFADYVIKETIQEDESRD